MSACYGVPGWLPESHADVSDGDERIRMALDHVGAWLARMSWRRDHLGRWSATFNLSRLSRLSKGTSTMWRPALKYEALSDEEALAIWRQLPAITPSPNLADHVVQLRLRCAVA